MPRRRTALVITLCVLLLLAIATGVAALAGWGPFTDDPTATQPSPTATEPVEGPDPTATATTPAPTPSATPAPTAEPSASEDPAEPAGPPSEETDAAQPAPPTGTDSATVVITYSGWEDASESVEAGAYASLLEPAGSCTLSLSQGAVTMTQTIDALTDVSTMSCGGFQIPSADLSPGTWTAVVSYASSTSTGTSAPVEVIVP